VVCGTERHPYQLFSVNAARRERLHSNEAKPSSYAIYPPSKQQPPHSQPSADFRAVYMGPCQKPTARYGSMSRKNSNDEGKAVPMCKHEAL